MILDNNIYVCWYHNTTHSVSWSILYFCDKFIHQTSHFIWLFRATSKIFINILKIETCISNVRMALLLSGRGVFLEVRFLQTTLYLGLRLIKCKMNRFQWWSNIHIFVFHALYPHRNLYKPSALYWTISVFGCAMVPVNVAHTIHVYFTGTEQLYDCPNVTCEFG